MAKTKSMGTEYQIIAKGNWEQVAEAARVTKEAIENTQQIPSFFSSRDIELKNKILKAYLVPQKGESFADYKSRFIQAFVGTGVKEKLALLVIGKKVPFDFHLTENDGESTLRICSITREGRYQATIGASGDYSDMGASIATSLRESLEQNSVQHTYKTLDRLI